jgi:peptidoglycan/LPS O-acetylase OafA/YrhL
MSGRRHYGTQLIDRFGGFKRCLHEEGMEMQSFGNVANGRANHFDAMRLSMAVAVIFGHSYVLTQGGDFNEPISRFSRGFTYSGSIAVDVFFIMSGYLIARSWAADPNVIRFLKKRALRIFPGYIVAVALSIFVVYPFASGGIARWRALVNAGILMRPLGSPDAFISNSYPRVINGSLWSIRYEVMCYVLVGVLGVAGLKGRIFPSIVLVFSLGAVAAQAMGILFFAHGEGGFGPLTPWPRALAVFFVGVCFFAWRDSLPRSATLAVLCGAFLATALHFCNRAFWAKF